MSASECGGGRQIRLQVAIARAGLASRRRAEELIAAGRVRVNGRVVRELGTRVDPERDTIWVGRRRLPRNRPPRYIAFHKPDGMLTTMSDPRGRPCVGDLIRKRRLDVYPVGRLDFHSSGLLLLTNDGLLCQRLSHPRYHVEKTYHVKVSPVPKRLQIARLSEGVELEDGRAAASRVRLIRATQTKAWLEVRLTEGRTRLLRRMCEAVGLRVDKLRRVAVGPLELGGLAPGQWRELSRDEVEALRRACGLETQACRPRRGGRS